MTIGLDFLGIGAQKAGTTSLHEYMRTHPQLYLPEAKEQPFFTDDDGYAEGWETFSAVAFHGAPRGRRYGKITPHYLAGPVAWHPGTPTGEPASAVNARRIAQHFPELKPHANEEVVVHCRTGGRSLQFAQILRQQGFKNVKKAGG